MKKEKILKLMVVLTIGTILVAMTSNVFAADSSSGIDFFEDQTNQLNTTTNTNTNTNANTNSNTTNTATNNTTNTTNTIDTTNTSTNVNTTNTENTTTNANNYNTNLPTAGAPENTMVGIALTVLAIVAIFAYKKVNQYKNI